LRYAEGHTSAANLWKIADNPTAINFRYMIRDYLSALYFTNISYTVVTQIAARATALRSAPTLSVILVANVAIRPPQQSCAEVHIHLFLICILWLRSHLKAKLWNYAMANCPFAA